MFHPRIFILLMSAFMFRAAPTSAQFYAPDTEFHDLAQRCFVVEAARVLAWRENQKETKYAEVTFKVATQENQETVWNIQWLDSRSNVVRRVTVTYPDSLLKDGPNFYRNVFRQLWNLKWLDAEKSNGPDIAAEFWRGVNDAGYSRVETLQAAWKYQQSKPSEEKRPARLAGLLQGAAAPAIGGAVSLDALLLARSAAWLCLAELGAADGARTENCWAPTLFLAGRDNAAVALWKKHHEHSRSAEAAGPISQGWSFLLQRPRATAGYVYAAAKEHRRFAVPIMIYHCGTADIASTLGTAAYAIFNEDETTLMRLYDYAPYFSLGAGVSGGRVMEGMWPTLARQAWMAAVQAQPLSRLDYSGHTSVVQKSYTTLKATRWKADANTDASVLGLAETAPIWSEAYKEGLGPLIPTDLATARDLLQYGWESTCVNLETRHRFVSQRWGVPDLADAISTNAIFHVKGSSTFFLASPSRDPSEMVTRVRRMQFADTSSYAVLRFPLPIWSENFSQNPKIYWRRCWLRPWLIAPQVSGLLGQHHEEIVPFLTRFHLEGGATGDATALYVLVNHIPYNQAVKIPGKQKLQKELAQSLVEPSILQLNTSWDEKYEKMPFFERGQELEKVFWDAPDIGIYGWIFHNYLRAYAETSAKRFYRQVADMINEPIGLANGIGQMRYALAALDNDRAAMKQALADSDCGSMGNMMMLVWEAAITGNDRALGQQVDEAIERYPTSSSNMRRLKDFVPLLPALADPRHPGRPKALDFFANNSEWTFLQWILIQKHHLTTDEAIKFLGGTETDLLRQALISYLRKDKARYEEQFIKVSNTDEFVLSRCVLLLRLRKELLAIKEPEGQRDLKPADALTVEKAMLGALEKSRR